MVQKIEADYSVINVETVKDALFWVMISMMRNTPEKITQSLKVTMHEEQNTYKKGKKPEEYG